MNSQIAGTGWVCCSPIEGQDRIRDQSPITRCVLEIKHANLELSVTGPICSNFLLAGAQINLDYEIHQPWGMLCSTTTLLTNPLTMWLTFTSNLCYHDREPLSVYIKLKSKYLLYLHVVGPKFRLYRRRRWIHERRRIEILDHLSIVDTTTTTSALSQAEAICHQEDYNEAEKLPGRSHRHLKSLVRGRVYLEFVVSTRLKTPHLLYKRGNTSIYLSLSSFALGMTHRGLEKRSDFGSTTASIIAPVFKATVHNLMGLYIIH